MVDEQNLFFSSDGGVLFDKNRSILIKYPGAKKGKYTVPDSTSFIEEGAFSDCRALTYITFPQRLKYRIQKFEFHDCKLLTDIIVDKSNPILSSIDGVLFNKESSNLLVYPQGKNHTDYTVPNGVICIGDSAFCNCTSLVNVVLPEGLMFIGSSAFYGCIGLDTITFPISLQYIGNNAFDDCINLKTLILSRKTKIEHYAFYNFPGKIIYSD